MIQWRMWAALFICFCPALAHAAGGGMLPALTVSTNPDGGQDYSLTLQVLGLMTALTFLPSIVIMMTSFTRIIVVLVDIAAGNRFAAKSFQSDLGGHGTVHVFFYHVASVRSYQQRCVATLHE
jgi:Flagellar biosynthesis pathway, component FliP